MLCSTALSVEKSMKVKTHDKSTTHDQNVITASRHCPIPTKDYYFDDDDDEEYNLINIIMNHNTYSVSGLVQAIEWNGKYMLTLGGINPYSESSKNSVN